MGDRLLKSHSLFFLMLPTSSRHHWNNSAFSEAKCCLQIFLSIDAAILQYTNACQLHREARIRALKMNK